MRCNVPGLRAPALRPLHLLVQASLPTGDLGSASEPQPQLSIALLTAE